MPAFSLLARRCQAYNGSITPVPHHGVPFFLRANMKVFFSVFSVVTVVTVLVAWMP